MAGLKFNGQFNLEKVKAKEYLNGFIYDAKENLWYKKGVKTNANLRSHGLGVMTGIALEVRPIRFIGLLLGTRYRLVHMGELSGSGTIKDSNGGEASINSGILYYYNNRELAPEIDPLPMLIYAEEKPVGLDGLREARLNLNGWTFLVGLRFWF